MKFAREPNPKNSAKAYGRSLRISRKDSAAVCKTLTGKTLDSGRMLLQDLLDRRRSLSGKYHTNVTREMIKMLNSAEANAEAKGLDPARLRIHASAHQGFSFFRPRHWKRRREKRKVCNIQMVLEVK